MRYIRTKPLASTFFKANGGPGTVFGAIPRYKYMFYANFVASQSALELYPEYARLGNWEKGVSFKIHGIDKPSIDLNYSELNQYNRKRYAYTKLNYHPFNIKMYDTVDDIPLELWRRYFTYYFGDSRSKGAGGAASETIYNQGVTSSEFSFAPGWGFTPIKEGLNFFSRVELYAIYGGRYTQISYINPKIVKIDWQQYESSDSNPAEMSMTMTYEAIDYKPSTRIGAYEANLFGFDIEQTNEVPGVPVPDQNLESWAPRTEVYSLLDRILSGNFNLTPTDILQGIGSAFTIANTTLNMFNQLPIGAISPTAARVIGQANQQLTYGRTGLTLVTNGNVPSQFLGTGYSYSQQAAGVLGQFGRFNFGGR